MLWMWATMISWCLFLTHRANHLRDVYNCSSRCFIMRDVYARLHHIDSLASWDHYSSPITIIKPSCKKLSIQDRLESLIVRELFEICKFLATQDVYSWLYDMLISRLSLPSILTATLHLSNTTYKSLIVRELFVRCTPHLTGFLFSTLLNIYSWLCKMFILRLSLSSSLVIRFRPFEASL